MLKYGLIPEFIGRVPVIVSLDDLDEDALVRILTEPRNALIKQYKKLFEMDDVILEFEEEAIRLIAKKAIQRETGARGLRAILEELMTDVMYEIPSTKNVEKCIITKATIEKKEMPQLIINENKQPIKKKRKKRANRGETA